jgi:putative membrane protein
MQSLTIMDSLAGLGSFLGYFTAAILLLILFAIVYGLVTPYGEFQLIKEGKVAPAISIVGALLGFVAPLASAITHSVALMDMIVWAFVALVVQIGVFISLRLIFADLCKEIAADHRSAAILLGGVSLAVGILNAACMSY